MTSHTGVVLVVGAAPVLGDVFDLVFKANNRNFALLRKTPADGPTSETDIA